MPSKKATRSAKSRSAAKLNKQRRKFNNELPPGVKLEYRRYYLRHRIHKHYFPAWPMSHAVMLHYQNDPDVIVSAV